MEKIQDIPKKYGGRTAAQYREWAYKNRKEIDYSGNRLTINEANELWLAYFAEGNIQKTDEIKQLIISCKEKMREIYK